MRVVLRERMDFGPPPPAIYKNDSDYVAHVVAATLSWSILHKVWDNGTVEYYYVGLPPSPEKTAQEAWDQFVAAGILPQPVGENSEWGEGLPAPERDLYFASRR